MKYTQKQIEHAALAAHEINRAYCFACGDNSQQTWREAPKEQRESAFAGVFSIIENPDITPEQQHALWLAHKQKEGWIYSEKKNTEKKTHPCMLPYNELPTQQRMKDVIFGAVVRGVLSLAKPQIEIVK